MIRPRHMNTPESDLCARLAEVLRRDGWEVFHSVRVPGRTWEMDLCGVRRDEYGELITLAIEAKQTPTLELYAKAMGWIGESTYVAVAVAKGGEYTGLACLNIHRHCGIGMYYGGKTLYEPKRLSPDPDYVSQLAIAARASSTGLVVKGGSRAPRKATNIVLAAERIAAQIKVGDAPGMSMSEMISEATADERNEVAKLINGKCGRGLGLRAKRSGDDYIIYPR